MKPGHRPLASSSLAEGNEAFIPPDRMGWRSRNPEPPLQIFAVLHHSAPAGASDCVQFLSTHNWNPDYSDSDVAILRVFKHRQSPGTAAWRDRSGRMIACFKVGGPWRETE